MSDIYVDEKGNMIPVYPKNRRAYSIGELQEKLGGYLVDLVDVGKYYVAYSLDGKSTPRRPNFLATMWLKSVGINDEVLGPAMLIRKEAWNGGSD